jgi:esterase/lipase superfamily enzyme
MKEEYFKWYSPNLEIEMLVLDILDTCDSISYFNGSYHENKDMGLIESAKWYIEQGLIQIFCPDSIDKDSFITSRFIPFIASKTMCAMIK